MGAPTLYLAGPEVFLPDARGLGRRKQALCAAYGFHGLYPLDNELSETADARLDQLIYRANVAMIHAADAGIFNLSPFRGPSADAGTVFELGLMVGLDKPCFAYTNDARSLLARMQALGAAMQDPATGLWVDPSGHWIEDFGNSDNLMIDAALAQDLSAENEKGGGRFVRPSASEVLPLDDLSGFTECLTRAARHFGITPPGEPGGHLS
jgi:nucleoside 2-deoxyribosyltransferase